MAGAGAPVRRRVSRRQREARQRRLLLLGMTLAGALVALLLVGGAVWENILKPRTVLATVGGEEIRRREYWQVRSIDLIQQAGQYQQIAQFVQGEQAVQYQQLAAQALQDLEDVWGSTEVDEATLQRMVDDQVYLQNIDELGLEVTDAEVETYVLNQFAPSDAPLVAPTPSPTLIPARAEWATQTAVANEAATSAAAPAPTSAAIPPPPGAAPPTVAAPVAAAGTPVASPVASPAASPPASPAATPNPDQARATAEAGYAEFRGDALERARMSRADYERLVARPAVARQEVEDHFAARVGQSADQVRAAHILVETRDLAQDVYNRVTEGGADFAQVARELSTDEGTAPNGGDLGWFAREEMVPPFAEAAFALEPGQTSEPVQTEFGWHVIRVFERAPDRPLTDEQIEAVRQARVTRWLEEQRAETSISSDELEPTPTPGAETFQPPVEAPPTPTPTPSPIASPAADPAAGTPVP